MRADGRPSLEDAGPEPLVPAGPHHHRPAPASFSPGVARAVDGEYQTFDFRDWGSAGVGGDARSRRRCAMPVPRKVIVLTTYDRVPRRPVRFSRHNVYARDRPPILWSTAAARSSASTTWCRARRAGCRPGTTSSARATRATGESGNTPQQAGIRLLRPGDGVDPVPRRDRFGQTRYRGWRPFLSFLDGAHGDGVA